ncbi:hypothetical protein BBJ28_00015867 [Nothophytophthora sp. Chile5]|nr:hypothetical protein BBJ28_00015867 [Nothophytophthora sp. Chile5]
MHDVERDDGYHRTTWTPDALPPAELSPVQRENYRLLAAKLLANTLRDYDIHCADPRQRRMSRRRWKPVKTRDHITVYKERHPTPSASSFASGNRWTGPTARSSRASIADRVSTAFRGLGGGNGEWMEPKLLVATGWIDGTLDDVMYGVTSPDARGMLLKATVVKNTLINGAVLACIDPPSANDPFQFLGLKWFVKGPPAALQGIVRPRDLVFIEATGIITRPNGERVGFQLLHSVDPPQYRDMTPRSGMEVTRGRISSCSIFRELPVGRRSRNPKVDVYVKGYVEAHGKLMDSVALTAASTGFLSSWNTVECANLKKLMWCFRRQQGSGQGSRSGATRRRRFSLRSNASSSVSSSSNVGSRPMTPGPEASTVCGTCSKRLAGSVACCALCSRATCSRCRLSRTLKDVNVDLRLRQEDVLVCKRCLLSVDHLGAVDVARAEVQAGWFGAEADAVKPDASLMSFASTGGATDTNGSNMTLPAEEEQTLSMLSPTADAPIDSFRGVMSLKMSHNVLEEETTEDVEGVINGHAPLSDHERREQIWSQMVELRMVAESIYQLTLETSESLNVVTPRQRY